MKYFKPPTRWQIFWYKTSVYVYLLFSLLLYLLAWLWFVSPRGFIQ